MSGGYVHGYQPRENERLDDQAGTLIGVFCYTFFQGRRAQALSTAAGQARG